MNLINEFNENRYADVQMCETNGVWVAFLPFFHIYGLAAYLGAALVGKCKVVLMTTFVLTTYLSTIEKYKVS